MLFFVDDFISEEVQWRQDDATYKALTASPADAYFHASRERGAEEAPKAPSKKITGWSTAREISELGVDSEDMTAGLPQRKPEDLRHRLKSWPLGWREATVREVFSLAEKRHTRRT